MSVSPNNKFSPPGFVINLQRRAVLTSELFSKDMELPQGATSKSPSILRYLYKKFTKFRFFPTIRGYSLKSYFLHDVNAALVLSAVVIPQAMAYAILAKLPPVTGLYVSIIQPFIYSIFATTPFISFGTFALLSMMVGDSIDVLCQPGICSETERIQHGASLALTMGLIQMIMMLLNFGKAANLLDKTVVRSFSTAVAFHIAFSQIHNILGLPTSKESKIHQFPLVSKLHSLAKHYDQINYVDLMICVTSVGLLLASKTLTSFLKKKYRIPSIPFDLLVVVFLTLICKFTSINETFDVSTVGTLPLELPSFPPKFHISLQLIYQAALLSVVSVAMHLSFVKFFQSHSKGEHKLESNDQELLATSLTNFVSSWFSCYPGTASLSRSMILSESESRSQLSCIMACCFVASAFALLRSFFQAIPMAVLAGVILVALRKLWAQFQDIPKLMRESHVELAVWVATFSASLIFSCEIGLLIGCVCSVIRHLFLQNRLKVTLLGNSLLAPDVFTDQQTLTSIDSQAHEQVHPSCPILRVSGPLNTLTIDQFLSSLSKLVVDTPLKDSKKFKSSHERIDGKFTYSQLTTPDPAQVERAENCVGSAASIIIIDFNHVSYVDYLCSQQLSDWFTNAGNHLFILICSRQDLLASLQAIASTATIVPSANDAISILANLNRPQQQPANHSATNGEVPLSQSDLSSSDPEYPGGDCSSKKDDALFPQL